MAPLVIACGLDYSAARIPGAAIAAAGYQFVNRYLWFPGQRHAALIAEEYQDLVAAGLEVHAIYEQNVDDPRGGYAAGVQMARQAVDSARAVGLLPGSTIYMCADSWLAGQGISVATAMRFLDGARSVIDPAGYLTGAYGFADFVYAAQDGGHADRFWLCGAESGVRDGVHQYQWNNGRVSVNGVDCDLNQQYLPMHEGDDDMATVPQAQWDETWEWVQQQRAGKEHRNNAGVDYIATLDMRNRVAAVADQVPAILALLSQIHQDPTIDADKMREIVETAQRDANAKQLEAIGTLVESKLGLDNTEQARDIVAEIGKLLAGGVAVTG